MDETNQATQTDALELDPGAVTYEDLTANHTCFDKKSCADFVRFQQEFALYDATTETLTRSLKRVQEKPPSLFYAAKVEDLERQIALLKTDRAERQSSPIKSQADWEAIKKMRGVTNIAVNWRKDSTEPAQLQVSVRVRVPYAGAVYDFGDYLIEIENSVSSNKNGDYYTCTCSRSGVRYDQDDAVSFYLNDDNTFCFGDRAYALNKYLQMGQLRVALMLMIDSLHSVNDESDARDIPYTYRRIVSPPNQEVEA